MIILKNSAKPQNQVRKEKQNLFKTQFRLNCFESKIFLIGKETNGNRNRRPAMSAHIAKVSDRLPLLDLAKQMLNPNALKIIKSTCKNKNS